MKKLLLLSILFLALNARQPKPLENFGCSCYVNATIQSLYAINPLTNILLTNRNLYATDSWPQAYTNLIQKFNSNQDYSLELKVFFAFVDSKTFEYTKNFLAQQDPTEFLEPFLTELKQKPEIERIIKAELETITKAEGYDQRRLDPSNIIKAPIVGTTLKTCLDEFFKLEKIDKIEIAEPVKEISFAGEYKPGTRQYSIKHLSDVVIIALNRFNAALQKIPTKLNIPLTISFEDYTSPKNANYYELVGVVIHNGLTLYPGHYVAFAKHEEKWWFCDDSRVSIIDQTQLNSLNPSLGDGYVFFYQKTTAVPMPPQPQPTPAPQPPVTQPDLKDLNTALQNLSGALNKLENALTSK